MKDDGINYRIEVDIYEITQADEEQQEEPKQKKKEVQLFHEKDTKKPIGLFTFLNFYITQDSIICKFYVPNSCKCLVWCSKR